MGASWPTKKLGVICDINGGNAAPQNYAVFSDDGIPFVRMQDLGRYHVTDNLTETRDKIKKEAINKLGIKIFPKGSIILPRSGSVFANHRAILGIDAAVVSHIAILNNYKGIEPRYLFWYLTKLDIGRHAVKTSNVDSISFQRLKKFEIPLPPLATQKQIVERLGKITEAQKLNDDLIQKTDELFQSLLHKELNPNGKVWKIKKIKDVATVGNGGTPSTKNPKYWNGKILWLTPKELSGFEDMEIFDTERKISDQGLNHSSAALFSTGTVLFTSRAPIGYIAIAGVPMATNQGFKNFVCDSKQLNNKFLYFFLRLKKKYLQSLGRGATFTEISKTIVEKVEIPLPPLGVQKQIVAKLSAVQDYKKQLLEQKSKLKELFDSALAKSMKN